MDKIIKYILMVLSGLVKLSKITLSVTHAKL